MTELVFAISSQSQRQEIINNNVCVCSIAAVSGAHNTIVTARAGKDLMSSLCSGLLTIVSKSCH